MGEVDVTETRPISSSAAFWRVPFLLLFLQQGGVYGHQLTRSVGDVGFAGTRPEMMYRALRQMEKEGMVVCERDGVDRRLIRRRYSITVSGEDYLGAWANSLDLHQRVVNQFLTAYGTSSRKARQGA